MFQKVEFDEEEEEEEDENLFVESVLDTEKYKSKDDLEVLEVAIEMRNFHVPNKTKRVPNWKKFPKSSMKRSHIKRHSSQNDLQKFRLFCSKLSPYIFYPVEELVKSYNSIFTNSPVSNIWFGKLSDVRKNFTKYRKEVDGKTKIFYVKKI